MNSASDRLQSKVLDIYRRAFGDVFERLSGKKPAPADLITRITNSLSQSHPRERAAQIAFHLTDWRFEAAVLVALCLFPERFTDEEIAAGMTDLIIHAPNHLAAAAKLAGYPVADVFGVGPLLESES